MASTRTLYDNCTTPTQIKTNNSLLQYAMDPNKHYNCNQCSNEFGLVAGNDVSIVQNNMVDLESQFRGLNTHLGKCAENQPSLDCIGCNGQHSGPGYPCGSSKCAIQPSMTYLKSCKIIDYGTKPVLQPSQVNMPKCPVQPRITQPTPVRNLGTPKYDTFANPNTWK